METETSSVVLEALGVEVLVSCREGEGLTVDVDAPSETEEAAAFKAKCPLEKPRARLQQ